MSEIATWICWGVVIVTWVLGAAYGARSAHGRHQGSRSATLWRLGSVVAAAVVYLLGRHELRRVTDDSTWIELPGLVFLVTSTVFTLWARLRLGRMWSASPDVLKEHHELRTDGPYAITRHPIYTGLFGMMIGTVLLNGLGVSLTFLAIGAVVLGPRIPVEERLMSRTFPDEYAHYRQRVPRLVPGTQLLRRSH